MGTETVGTERVDPLEFLDRVLVHIPDKGHVTTRYYGWYVNRPRGMRRQAESAPADAPSAIDQILTHLRTRAFPAAAGGAGALRRLSVGARMVGDRAVYSTNTRPTPIEIRIPSLTIREVSR